MIAQVPFSKEHALIMKVGEQFETEGVFLGASNEKLLWKVVTTTGKAEDPRFFLEARYCGVYFGTFTFYRGKLAQERLA